MNYRASKSAVAKRCALAIAVATSGMGLAGGAVAQQPAGKAPAAPSAAAQGAVPAGKGGPTSAAATSAAPASGATAPNGAPASSATATAAATSGTTTAASAGSSAATLGAPVVRKTLPPPPPPTQQQLEAYETLKKQVSVYEQGAREYRDTVTDIVKLHYGRKKREILSDLDLAVAEEKKALREAQQTAIEALEKFIAEYSGPNKDEVATPNAMYRLAALYEDRARGDDAKEEVAIGLRTSIRYYKRILVEFPSYAERAGVLYFLGHALNDSGRTDEAQQVWRSLVCNNHFAYPTATSPTDPEVDVVRPLPQDNKEEFWIGWRQRYPTPDSLRRKGRPTETVYLDPYPTSCKAVAQPNVRAGEDPKYVQEVWWQIGNWEFDQLDVGAGLVRGRTAPADLLALPGVWGYNRAASSYQHALQFKNRNLYGVALYKYAWTLFKQQRYEAAVREFVHLLNFTDEQQALTGDPGADFRAEAYQYIAGSLMQQKDDFKGPDADEPYISRTDPIEEGAIDAEKRLHVAVDRVQDNGLVPQDKPWAIEIYKSLATEMRGVNHFVNAVEVYEAALKKWPMHPSAPEMQAAIAETYDQMNVISNRPGTPDWDRVAGKALEGRTALANYIGNTPWVDANKDNPQAIQNAERLVKGGLRNAAAAHTNNARQALADAQASSDPKYQVERLQRAQADYRLAALGWNGYLKQDENAPDAYESRYWLSDARFNNVRIGVVLNKLDKSKFPEPTAQEIQDARQSAMDVRDSNEDDKYLQNAAIMVVGIADVRRDLEYQRFEATSGQAGIERVSELKRTDDGKPVKQVVPPAVLESMAARDEYVQRVPTSADTEQNTPTFQYYVAETFFFYGHFDEARQRFEPMYKERCGKDKYGYFAWEKLIAMSNATGDADRSRQLAEAEKAKSCAISDEQRERGALIVNPTLQEAAYVKAREKFEQAQKASPGPERDKLWRETAALYEAALSAAPGRDEAPEAAMNAAYAYKQVGEYNKAIDLYGKFIAEYGSDERLTALQKGDPKTKKAPDLKKYEERVKFLGQAYDALSSTYYGFFNYQRAAETFDKIASNGRFDEKKRKDAARNAMILYANMGQRAKMLEQQKIYAGLKPTAEEKANADFLVADYDYRQWNPQGADSGGNRDVRVAADRALQQFYAGNRNNGAASKYALEAAYKVSKLKRAGNDPAAKGWLKSTINAWEAFDRQNTKTADGGKESQLPPYADMGAEAEYTLLDEEIREKFDYETGHHRYAGAVDEIVGEYDQSGQMKKPGKFQASVKEAGTFKDKLDHTISTYKSPEWTPAALARQGSLYDSIRTALYETRAPALKYFTAKEEALLRQLENSGRDDLQEKADQYRDAKKDAWRERRDREISGADEVAVNRYVTAVLLARQLNVRNPSVSHAIARLAYLENVSGPDKMQTYVVKVVDPSDPEKKRTITYSEGMFMQSRAGLTATPPPSGAPMPAPVPPAGG